MGNVMEHNTEIIPTKTMNALTHASINLIRQSRDIVSRDINRVQIITYFILGAWIVEVQQQGQKRAGYGQQVIKQLATALTAEFGKGYSHETLKNCRKFYLTYMDRIGKPTLAFLNPKKANRWFAFSIAIFPSVFLGRIT